MAALVAAPSVATAATLTWGTSGTGGTGNWDTTTGGWWNGTTNVAWVNSNNDIAAFGGTAGTVTLTTGITTNGMIFNTTGYTVTGGTVTLAGTTPTITANNDATIGSSLAGSAGLVKTGAGTLSLTGANTYTGVTSVTGGTLSFSGGSLAGAGEFRIGNGSAGAVTLTGAVGTIASTGAIQVGYGSSGGVGTLTVNAGTISSAGDTNLASSSGGAGTINVGGGTLSIGNRLIIADANVAGNVVTLSSGTITATNSVVFGGGGAGATTTGTFNLNGGTLNSGAGGLGGNITRYSSNGTYTFNFNGGTLKNSGSTATLLAYSGTGSSQGGAAVGSGITYNVQSGGAIFDTSNGNATAAATFVAASGNGGLTKNGGNRLTLTGTASTNALNMTVNSGTLQLANTGLSYNNTGGVGNGGSITVNSGGTLDLGYQYQLGSSPTVYINGGTMNLSAGSSTDGLNYALNLSFTGGGSITGNPFRWGENGNATITVNGTTAATISSGIAMIVANSRTGTINVVDPAGQLNVTGVISDRTAGGVPLTKTGPGTLTLSGANTQTSTTTLSAGQLNINSATAIGTGGFTISGGTIGNTSGTAVTLSTNNTQSWGGDFAFGGSSPLNLGTGAVTLTANRQVTVTSSTLTVGGAIGGGFQLAKAGAGTLKLTGANTYTGITSVTGGTLNFSGGSLAGGGEFRIGNGATGSMTLDGSVGTITATNVNINVGYGAGGVGTLTVTSGTLKAAGTAGDLNLGTSGGTSGSLIVNGGVVNLAGTTAGRLIIGDSNVGTNTATLTSGSITVVSVVFGGGGAGTSTVGVFNLDGGVLTTGYVWRYSASAVNPYTFNFNGGSIVASGNSGNFLQDGGGYTVTYAVKNGGAIFDTAGYGVTVAHALVPSASSTGGLTKINSGTLTLSAANTYTGPTSITGGVLSVSSDSNLGAAPGSATAGQLAISSGTLAVTTGFALNANRGIAVGPASASGTGGIDVASGQTLTYAGIIANASGGTGGLTKSGAGTLTLSGNNSFSGATTVSGGTLALSGAGSVASSSGVNVSAAGAVFDVSGASGGVTIKDLSGSGTVTLGSNGLTAGSGGNSTFSGGITGSGGLTKAGAGMLTLSGSNAYTGTTTISAGTLALSGAGSIASSSGVNVSAASTVFDISGASGGVTIKDLSGSGTVTLGGNGLTAGSANASMFSGGITGSGGLTKAGAGMLTLSGSNAYTGVTTLSGGTLALGSANAIGTTGSISFTGGTLQYTASNNDDYSSRFSTSASQVYAIDTNGRGVTYATALTSSGGSLTKLGSGTLTLTAAATYSGNTTISGGVLELGSAGSVAGTIVNNATLRVNRSGTLTLSNAISGTGSLVQAGSGTTTLSVVNSYTGPTSITGGVLSVSQDLNLGTVPGSTTPGSLVVNGGALAVTTGFILDSKRGILLGPASGSGSGTIDVASGQTLTYGGVIGDNTGGADSLVKAGAGVLALSGVNTFSGSTSINAGTLQVGAGSSLASSLVTVASGATLSGRGTVNATTVASGGILAPGVTSSGTLTTGNLSIAGLSTITMGVAVGLPTNLLNVLGDVTPSGGAGSVTFAFGANLATITTGTYSLLTYSGTLTDTSAFLATGTTGARQSVAVSGTTVAGAVSLVIGNAFPIWTGDNGTGWFTTDNWDLNTTLAPTSFLNNDTVLFNDLATSGTVVISGSNATPASTTFAGDNLAMTVQATGGFGISTGSLIKSGSALLTITNSNAFGDGTTLSAGRIRLGDNAALGTGGVTVTGTATGIAISSDGASARTFANNLQLNADLTLGHATDTGVLTATGTVTFDGQTRTITTPSNVTLAGRITNGGFTKTGAGVLTITGSNDYAAGTTLSAGSIRVGNDAALGASTVTLADGVSLSSDSTTARTPANALALNGNVTLGSATDTGSLTLGGNGISLGGGTRQVTTASDVTFAGAVTNGGLAKLGPATLTLATTNSYSGGTTLSSGTLVAANAGALGSGNLTLAGAATFRTTVGGTLASNVVVNAVTSTIESATSVTLSGSVANAGTLTLSTAATQTLAGVVSGTGTVVKAGAGTTSLTGTSTYTGDTTITTGTLQLGGAGLLGNGSYAGAISNAGVLSVATSANQTFSGLISGTGSLTRSGAGLLTLTNAANSFSGGSTITGGTVSFASGALGPGAVTVNGGTLLWASGNTQDVSSQLALVNGGTGTLDVGANNVTLATGFGGATSGAVAKAGAGTLTLTGSNTYTGLTTVSGGTLQIGAGGSGGSLAGNVANTSALVFNRGDAYAYAGVISGTGAVRQSGAGTLSLTAVNTYTGATTISSGTLQLGNGGTTGALSTSSAITVASGATLAFNRSTAVAQGTDFANTIAGAGGIVMLGSGTLSLSGSNSFTGDVTVNAGTLLLNSNNGSGGWAASGLGPYGTAKTVTIASGATLLTTGANDNVDFGSHQWNAIAFVISGTWNNSPTTANTGFQRVDNLTLNNGVINDSGNLGAYGGILTTGTTTVYGTSTYNKLGNGAGLTLGSPTTISVPNADGRYVVNSGMRDFGYNYSTGVTTVGSFIKTGAGTMMLNGTSSYSGNTTISGGTLAIGATGRIYGGGFFNNVLTINSGATLDLQNWAYGETSQNLGGLTASSTGIVVSGGSIRVSGATATSSDRGVTVNSGGVTLEAATGANWTISTPGNYAWVYNGNPTITLAGAGLGQFDKVLGNGTGGLVKSGAGTWTLTGVNTFSGNTTISSGSLVLGGAGQFGSGNYSGAISNVGGLSFASSANQTLSGAISGVGSLAKSGAGTLTLTNASNSYSGGTTLSAGTLLVGADAALGTGTVSMSAGTVLSSDGGAARSIANALAIGGDVTFGNATNTGALSFSSGIDLGGVTRTFTTPSNVAFAGPVTNGGLTKTGAGSLTLSNGVNSYSGGTTLNQGTIAFANGGLGSSGNVTLADATTLRWASGNTQDISARLILPGSGTATLDVGSNNVTLASGFASGTVGSLTKTGAGTLTISGTPGYTGNTTVSNGTLAVTGSSSLANSAQVSIAPGAALDISTGSSLVNVGALAGSGSVALGSKTLRSLVPTAGSTQFDGVIGGSGGFTKAGAGTLTLTQLQDFTGTARVEAGTLSLYSLAPGGDKLLQNASAIFVASGATLDASTSGLAVVAGQTLGGYGTVDVGSTTLVFEANSILSPGGSVGPLTTTGTVAFTGPMSYVFDVNDASGTAGGPNGWDLYTANTFTFTGFDTNTNRFVVDLTSLSGTTPNQDAANFNPSNNYAWKFLVASDLNPISVTNGWFQVDTTHFTNSPHPGNFYVARGDQLGAIGGSGDTNALYVVYAAVPEPGSLALAAIGLATAAWAARRRRRSTAA